MTTIPTPIWFTQYEDEHLAEELENLDRADAADRQSWEEWCDAVDLDALMERCFPTAGTGETGAEDGVLRTERTGGEGKDER